jgi:hypothetical protein
VPRYYFQISHGRFSDVADCGIDMPDRDAAWVEMAKVCGNLAGTISRKMKQNAEWRMELLDEAKEPVFRVRIVAETLPVRSAMEL